MKTIANIFITLLVYTTVTVGQVSITAAAGGTNVVRSSAANGSSPAYTTLENIVILETVDDDIKHSQTNNTLILSAPPNWQFNPGAGTIDTTLGSDIESISMTVTSSTVTITLTTVNGSVRLNTIDEITISGLEVQPIDGNNVGATGEILQTSAASGSAKINGITNDVTSFGSLAVDPDSPMPVELISFTAESYGSAVYLNWATATEVNNYGFEVHRGTGDENWEVIGFVEGNGNSNSYKYYEFIDELFLRTNYPQTIAHEYRLKQIDLDGTFEYYGLKEAVELASITSIGDDALKFKYDLSQNYPNPFNPSTTIFYSVPAADPLNAASQHVKLVVYDILGKEVATLVNEHKRAGTYEVFFNASDLSSGMYIYILTAGRHTESRKMTLLK